MSVQSSEPRCNFVADPKEVHFPVTCPGYALRRSVRIVNSGKLSARMHVLPCKNPAFTVIMAPKQGFIAPGMHQRLEITYCPGSLDVIHESIYVQGEV